MVEDGATPHFLGLCCALHKKHTLWKDGRSTRGRYHQRNQLAFFRHTFSLFFVVVLLVVFFLLFFLSLLQISLLSYRRLNVFPWRQFKFFLPPQFWSIFIWSHAGSGDALRVFLCYSLTQKAAWLSRSASCCINRTFTFFPPFCASSFFSSLVCFRDISGAFASELTLERTCWCWSCCRRQRPVGFL